MKTDEYFSIEYQPRWGTKPYAVVRIDARRSMIYSWHETRGGAIARAKWDASADGLFYIGPVV